MTVSSPNFARILALLLCLAALPCGVFAQRNRRDVEQAPAPPPVVPRQVTVQPGETVDIPLEMRGARAGMVEFLIRSTPKSGKLSAVAARGNDAAVVRYTAGTKPGADRFTYAVRTSEGVSAPALVSITIPEPPPQPPRLVVPDSLSFPDAFAGEKTAAELEISNHGGLPAAGTLFISGPWELQGSGRYDIAPGKSAKFQLHFVPSGAGASTGEVILGTGPGKKVVALSGKAAEPLELSGDSVELSGAQGSAESARTGTFTLVNRSRTPRLVKLSSSSTRLQMEPAVALHPGAKASVTVSVSASNPEPVDEKITASTDGWSRELPVRGAAMAGRVRFLETSLYFGRVNARYVKEASATLENTGGLPVSAALSISAPFQVSTPAVSIPARSRQKISIVLTAPEEGECKAELKATAGGVTEVLPCRADVIPMRQPAAAAPLAPVATPAPSAPPAIPVSSPPAPPQSPLQWPLPGATAHEAPGFPGRHVRSVASGVVTLEWDANPAGPKDFAVLARQLAFQKDGPLAVSWIPVKGVSFSESGGKHTAEITGLPVGTRHTLKVTAAGSTLFVTQVFVPEPPPFASTQTILITCILLAFGGFILWRVKKSRGNGW